MSGEQSKKAKKRCYAKHHLTMKMHSLYQHAIEVSYKSGIFYFNGEDIAEKVYTRTSKSSVYRVFKELVEAGWFVERGKPRQRQADGTYASTKVYVLTHDVWVQNHGSHDCRKNTEQGRAETGDATPEKSEAEEPEPKPEPADIYEGPTSIPKDGNGEDDDPFPSTGITIPKYENHHSQERESPFPKEGRSIVGEYCNEALSGELCAEQDKTPAASASLQDQNLPAPGGDVKLFINRTPDSELAKEFRESRLGWHEYDKFTSSDPEAWDNLTRRRTQSAGPLIRWLKEEHQLHFDYREAGLFTGLLFLLPVTDEELTVRPEGSLIQHAINEAMKEAGQNVDQLRFLLNTQFETYRKTYTALRDEKLLEPQPLGGVQ